VEAADEESACGLQLVVAEDEEESVETPMKNLQLVFEDMQVTPQKPKQKVQYGLGKFWSPSPSPQEMKPALEARAERLSMTLKGEHVLKRGAGRPSRAENELYEARRKGELLVVATLDQFNAAIAERAEEMKNTKMHLFAEKGGRVSTGGRVTGVAEDGLESNRRRPGAAIVRKDEAVGTKLKIAEHMKELRKMCASDAEWKNVCCKTYGKRWNTLKSIHDGEKVWRQRMKDLKLGYGSTGTTAAKGTCSKGGRALKKGGIGARRPGAGRPDRFSHLKMQVKAFLEKERSRCHHVDKQDLLQEFLDYCKQELELVQERIAAPSIEEDPEKKQAKKPMHEMLQQAVAGDFEEKVAAGFEGLQSSAEHVESLSSEELVEWEKELQNRIDRLNVSLKYKESFATRLLENIGGKLMQPGRMSTLSMEEEEAGVKATWKEFDAALWLAAFGSQEDLAKVVANPEEFIHQRGTVVIGFSDQIPVWVKIGRTKQVYCGDEVKKRKNTRDFKEMQQKKKQAAKEGEEQEEHEEEHKEAAEGDEEKKEAKEENKEPAEGNEEKKEAEEENKEPAEGNEEKKVSIQQLLVEDPNAKLEDEDMEQEILEMNEGDGL
jgi:hypothetical protein